MTTGDATSATLVGSRTARAAPSGTAAPNGKHRRSIIVAMCCAMFRKPGHVAACRGRRRGHTVMAASGASGLLKATAPFIVGAPEMQLMPTGAVGDSRGAAGAEILHVARQPTTKVAWLQSGRRLSRYGALLAAVHVALKLAGRSRWGRFACACATGAAVQHLIAPMHWSVSLYVLLRALGNKTKVRPSRCRPRRLRPSAC